MVGELRGHDGARAVRCVCPAACCWIRRPSRRFIDVRHAALALVLALAVVVVPGGPV